MKYVLPLNEAEIHTLSDMQRYHPSRRARMRAHSLLLSHHGLSIPQIARIYQVDRRSVSSWIDRWQTHGLVGLYDHPGAGRRPTLSADEQQKVRHYLQQSPKNLKQVVQQLEQDTTKRVSTKTIKRLIKKSGYVWKRIRKSPAKSPEPHKYERSTQLLGRLQQREAAGECDLWYFDVTGFCLTPCIPYAWQPRGEIIEVPTSSHNQRLNVLGFLKRNKNIVPYLVEGKVDTAIIVACFHQFSRQITKKTYVFLDNSPVHRAQEFIEQIPRWVKKGLIIKYLPSYAPELNLIEILWRCMKYYWLPFSAYASFQRLVEAIEEILTRFGTEYTIRFQAA
jgi:transposase